MAVFDVLVFAIITVLVIIVLSYIFFNTAQGTTLVTDSCEIRQARCIDEIRCPDNMIAAPSSWKCEGPSQVCCVGNYAEEPRHIGKVLEEREVLFFQLHGQDHSLEFVGYEEDKAIFLLNGQRVEAAFNGKQTAHLEYWLYCQNLPACVSGELDTGGPESGTTTLDIPGSIEPCKENCLKLLPPDINITVKKMPSPRVEVDIDNLQYGKPFIVPLRVSLPAQSTLWYGKISYYDVTPKEEFTATFAASGPIGSCVAFIWDDDAGNILSQEGKLLREVYPDCTSAEEQEFTTTFARSYDPRRMEFQVVGLDPVCTPDPEMPNDCSTDVTNHVANLIIPLTFTGTTRLRITCVGDNGLPVSCGTLYYKVTAEDCRINPASTPVENGYTFLVAAKNTYHYELQQEAIRASDAYNLCILSYQDKDNLVLRGLGKDELVSMLDGQQEASATLEIRT